MKIQSFLNGMLVGLIIGVLCAPSSGRETRRRISSRIRNFTDSLNDAHDVFKEELEDSMDSLKKSEEEDIQKIYHEIRNG